MKRRKRDIELRGALVMFVDVDHEKARSDFRNSQVLPNQSRKQTQNKLPVEVA
jgi:hypothetical protein